MILFRNVGHEVPPGWMPGANWQVEYYPDEGDWNDRGFPLGLAWVLETPFDPEWPYEAVVKFILVVDDERRKGIGLKLVRALQERWPGVMLTDPISEAGEALLRKSLRIDAAAGMRLM